MGDGDRAMWYDAQAVESFGVSPAILGELHRLVIGSVEEDPLKGVSFLLLHGPRELIKINNGAVNPTSDRRIDSHSLFPTASMTKTVTAICILMLAERGKVALQESVSRYLEELSPSEKRGITVHHLLTHTSGLMDREIERIAAETDHTTNRLRGEMGEIVADRTFDALRGTPVHAPGSRFVYCNYGYQILAEIVRRVSGKGIEDFSRTHLLARLGMDGSHFIVPDELVERTVRRYRPGTSEYSWFSRISTMKTPYGDGGLYSTVSDFSRIARMLLDGGRYGSEEILGRESALAMTSDRVEGLGGYFGASFVEKALYGYGIKIEESDPGLPAAHGRPSFNHGGADWSVFFWVDVNTGLIGLLFTVTPGRRKVLAVRSFVARHFKAEERGRS
jgi:CubicO group peptidase (beta-lactamase class C family)